MANDPEMLTLYDHQNKDVGLTCSLCGDGGGWSGLALFVEAKIAVCAHCARRVHYELDPPDPIED